MNPRFYGSLPSRRIPSREPNNRSSRKFPSLKTLAKYALAVATGLFIIATIVVIVVSKDLPDPKDPNQSRIHQSTKIYDRTGSHLLYETFEDQKRTVITTDQMSPFLPKAVIAIEDKYFYEHHGIRIPSIIRAGVSNIFHLSQGKGGASTITQQFIKNRFLGTQENLFQKMKRKIKEAILAVQLERKSTKEEILTAYLNEVWFGYTNYGVEAAAQSYFNKSAKDLTLEESATLAAMLPNPNIFLKKEEALKTRRDTVLKLMYEQGYISEEQKNQAQATKLVLDLSGGAFEAKHFVTDVREWLYDQFGRSVVRTSGFKVITTLDYDKQQIAEKVVKELGDKFAKDYNANNAALVALDPKTGQVLAEVGSRDFNNKEIDGQYNVVSGKRQPGSSFKPFVYLAAFEKGYTPETVVYDVRTDFDLRSDSSYNPKNATNIEFGLVTVRKALQGSLNIPAIKFLHLIGDEAGGRQLAERFGYHLDPKAVYGLTMVVGGAEMNMLEHANAYNTLANNGSYNTPASVLKVEDDQGKTLFEWHPDTKEIIKPEFVATLDNVLTDNKAREYIFKSKNNLILADRPVAAKTGTTNDNKDAWTLGYTPSLTAGVWVGNTKPKPMKKGGETLAGQIWNRFMSEALKGTPVEKFPDPPKKPEGLKPVLDGADGGIKVKINSLNGKIATSSTPPALIVEKTFSPPHDILHYVVKDDPRGPAPTDPSKADPQYDRWEQSLQDWVKRRQEKGEFIALEEPPQEIDSVIDPALIPAIEVISPASPLLTSRNLQLSVKATGPRGVSKVEYRLDNSIIGSSTAPPFSVSYYAQRESKGEHKLQIIASDDQGNQGYKELTITLQSDLDPPSIDWSGNQKTELSQSDFPYAFYLYPFRWDSIKEVKVTLQTGSEQKPLHTFTSSDELFSGSLYFTIDKPLSPGAYTLKALMTDKSGRTVEKNLNITVK